MDTQEADSSTSQTSFSLTPMQILHIYIPVNGQPQLRTPFCVKRVSTHERFHCITSLLCAVDY